MFCARISKRTTIDLLNMRTRLSGELTSFPFTWSEKSKLLFWVSFRKDRGRNSCGVNKSFMGRDRRKERPFVRTTHHSLSASRNEEIFLPRPTSHCRTAVVGQPVGLSGWHVASRCQLSVRIRANLFYPNWKSSFSSSATMLSGQVVAALWQI